MPWTWPWAGPARPDRPGRTASAVHRRDEHPRAGRGDLLVVGRGRLPLARGEPGLQGALVGEVQLGDPVVGLLAAVDRRADLAGFRPLQAGDTADQRHVGAEVMPVEG